jgi:hypothetical protein
MTPDNLRRIHAETGVSAILSLQHDECLAYWHIDYAAMCHAGAELGLDMARCPIRDFDICDMRRRLPTAMSMLADLRAQALRTYVHCTAGLGRAPLVVLGYLTLVEGYSPDDAIGLIKQGRPGVVPAWEAYHGCRNDLVARHRPAIEKRAYELYELKIHGNALADWLQAQAEVLRFILKAGDGGRH